MLSYFYVVSGSLPTDRGVTATVVHAEQGPAMSSSHDLSRKMTPDQSRAAEKVRLEARLAKREAWHSLQRLLERPSGKGLMAAIETAAERHRLERELADTCDDYRAWLALSGDDQDDDAPAKPVASAFKTRVRVKAAARSANRKEPASAPAPPKPAPPASDATPPRPMPRAMSAHATASRSRVVAEEASVVIVRRAKNGRVTLLDLPVAGRSVAMRDPMEGRARSNRSRVVADDAAPQTIAKRPI